MENAEKRVAVFDWFTAGLRVSRLITFGILLLATVWAIDELFPDTPVVTFRLPLFLSVWFPTAILEALEIKKAVFPQTPTCQVVLFVLLLTVFSALGGVVAT